MNQIWVLFLRESLIYSLPAPPKLRLNSPSVCLSFYGVIPTPSLILLKSFIKSESNDSP